MTTAIEAQLLRWSDNHNGRTVTFQLPADGEHPFRGLPCGPANGQRIALAVALISDDETTHDMASQAPEKPVSGGNGNGAKRRWEDLSRAQRAGIRCGEAAFGRFLMERYPGESMTGEDDDTAATLRLICGVDSRKKLDTDYRAGAIFDRVDSEYRAWFGL